MVKHKHFLRPVAALGLMLSLTGLTSAAALPGLGWFSSATIQNIDSGTANVQLQAFPGQGAAGSPSTGSVAIPQNENRVFLPGAGTGGLTVDVAPALGGGFQGSMVVSSDKKIVAVGQIGNNQQSLPGGSVGTPGGYASAQYRAPDAGAAELRFPTVKNAFGTPRKTTFFAIQAAGSNVTYQATIRANNGASYNKNGNIDANKSVLLMPSDFGMAANCVGDPNTASCVGSLTVRATAGSIVGTETEVAHAAPATAAQSTSLFTPADASDTIYCPVVKNNFDLKQRRYGGITVQNVGNAQITVKLELTVAGGGGATKGSKYSSSVIIPAGASRSFLGTLTGAGSLGGMPGNTYGAAKLTTVPAGGRIIATVSETNILAAASAQKSTTYACVAPAKATAKLAFPVVKEDFGATKATTGIGLQNVGTLPTIVDVVYTCKTAAGASLPARTLSTAVLNAGDPAPAFFQTVQVTNNALCTANATARVPGSKIIGIAQETSDPFGGRLDTKNYEGFNLQ